ncbi:MAG: hypothetical protein LBQ12_08460 [Deltaproteobacteria bacterium]|jgi:hypothetical protein|nr:hypothetical protein [Deltaproteobacteria bacterium]
MTENNKLIEEIINERLHGWVVKLVAVDARLDKLEGYAGTYQQETIQKMACWMQETIRSYKEENLKTHVERYQDLDALEDLSFLTQMLTSQYSLCYQTLVLLDKRMERTARQARKEIWRERKDDLIKECLQAMNWVPKLYREG